uniref:THAP-type domain-containing protein n=1 Tax=Meloidogyne incognita TaxID=6306 RepID=A0A914MK74_MELIC
MERCIFCGSTRKTAPNRRFFGIPREPGLKRIQWLYVLGDRDVGPKDRVCAVHFRQGKPSNDPSHEDYVPNLLMNSNNGESSLEFLDSIESANLGLQSKIKLPSILQKRKRKEDDKLPNSLGASSTLIPLPACLSEGLKLVEGQKVVIKRIVLTKAD